MGQSTNEWTDEWTNGPNGPCEAARKANKRMSPVESDFFDDFLREERIVFRQGWRHTLLGSVCALPWTIWKYPAGPAVHSHTTSQGCGLLTHTHTFSLSTRGLTEGKHVLFDWL